MKETRDERNADADRAATLSSLIPALSGPNASRDYITWDDAEGLDDFSGRPWIDGCGYLRLANAGAEYMVKRVRIPPRPLNFMGENSRRSCRRSISRWQILQAVDDSERVNAGRTTSQQNPGLITGGGLDRARAVFSNLVTLFRSLDGRDECCWELHLEQTRDAGCKSRPGCALRERAGSSGAEHRVSTKPCRRFRKILKGAN
jgi:hypothetical protein